MTRRVASPGAPLLLGLAAGLVTHVVMARLLLAAGFYGARPDDSVAAAHWLAWLALAAVAGAVGLVLHARTGTRRRPPGQASWPLTAFTAALGLLVASLVDLHLLMPYRVAWQPRLLWDTLGHLVPLAVLAALWSPAKAALLGGSRT